MIPHPSEPQAMLRDQALARGGRGQWERLWGFLWDAHLSRLWGLQPSLLKHLLNTFLRHLFCFVHFSIIFFMVDNWINHIIWTSCYLSASLGSREGFLIHHTNSCFSLIRAKDYLLRKKRYSNINKLFSSPLLFLHTLHPSLEGLLLARPDLFCPTLYQTCPSHEQAFLKNC